MSTLQQFSILISTQTWNFPLQSQLLRDLHRFAPNITMIKTAQEDVTSYPHSLLSEMTPLHVNGMFQHLTELTIYADFHRYEISPLSRTRSRTLYHAHETCGTWKQLGLLTSLTKLSINTNRLSSRDIRQWNTIKQLRYFAYGYGRQWEWSRSLVNSCIADVDMIDAICDTWTNTLQVLDLANWPAAQYALQLGRISSSRMPRLYKVILNHAIDTKSCAAAPLPRWSTLRGWGKTVTDLEICGLVLNDQSFAALNRMTWLTCLRLSLPRVDQRLESLYAAGCVIEYWQDSDDDDDDDHD